MKKSGHFIDKADIHVFFFADCFSIDHYVKAIEEIKPRLSLFSPGFRDLHRYTRPQEHHSVQPVSEAGPERSASVVGGRLHRRVRIDVTYRHRHRHQCDGGSASSWSANPGCPGGARRWDVCLHHLSGDPPTRAQLTWEAASQGALHPAGLQHHGLSDISGLRASHRSVGTSVRM